MSLNRDYDLYFAYKPHSVLPFTFENLFKSGMLIDYIYKYRLFFQWEGLYLYIYDRGGKKTEKHCLGYFFYKLKDIYPCIEQHRRENTQEPEIWHLRFRATTKSDFWHWRSFAKIKKIELNRLVQIETSEEAYYKDSCNYIYSRYKELGNEKHITRFNNLYSIDLKESS